MPKSKHIFLSQLVYQARNIGSKEKKGDLCECGNLNEFLRVRDFLFSGEDEMKRPILGAIQSNISQRNKHDTALEVHMILFCGNAPNPLPVYKDLQNLTFQSIALLIQQISNYTKAQLQTITLTPCRRILDMWFWGGIS